MSWIRNNKHWVITSVGLILFTVGFICVVYLSPPFKNQNKEQERLNKITLIEKITKREVNNALDKSPAGFFNRCQTVKVIQLSDYHYIALVRLFSGEILSVEIIDRDGRTMIFLTESKTIIGFVE